MNTVASKRPLEKFLSIFTEVRAGEAAVVLALTLNVFLILNAYYFIKPVREALILSGHGSAELKSYTAAIQTVLLLFIVPFYAWLTSRFPRRKLLNIVTLFFVACMLVFYALLHAGVEIAIVFYLWVGIYSLMVVAQFWSFANDIYTPEAGKRLFVIVAFGASLGAVAGSEIAAVLIERFGVRHMLPLAALLLASSLLLTNWVDAHSHGSDTASGRASKAPMERRNAFSMIAHDRYLLVMAFMILIYNWVNSNGEYLLGRLVTEHAHDLMSEGELGGHGEQRFIGTFYAHYFTAVNLIGLAMQLFVVSRLLKYLDVPVAVCVLPCLSIAGFAIAAIVPALAMVRWVKIAENSTDYSLQNTVRQVLFLPLTREEKYTGKQAIDTFFVRCGDLLSALLVFIGAGVMHLPARDFAIANVVIGILWLVLALMIGREYRKRIAAMPPERHGA